MLLSSSVRACVSSGDEAEEARDRMRRYEEKSDLVCFKVARTSLLMVSYDLRGMIHRLLTPEHRGRDRSGPDMP